MTRGKRTIQLFVLYMFWSRLCQVGAETEGPRHLKMFVKYSVLSGPFFRHSRLSKESFSCLKKKKQQKLSENTKILIVLHFQLKRLSPIPVFQNSTKLSLPSTIWWKANTFDPNYEIKQRKKKDFFKVLTQRKKSKNLWSILHWAMVWRGQLSWAQRQAAWSKHRKDFIIPQQHALRLLQTKKCKTLSLAKNH